MDSLLSIVISGVFPSVLWYIQLKAGWCVKTYLDDHGLVYSINCYIISVMGYIKWICLCSPGSVPWINGYWSVGYWMCIPNMYKIPHQIYESNFPSFVFSNISYQIWFYLTSINFMSIDYFRTPLVIVLPPYGFRRNDRIWNISVLTNRCIEWKLISWKLLHWKILLSNV